MQHEQSTHGYRTANPWRLWSASEVLSASEGRFLKYSPNHISGSDLLTA